MTSTGLERGLWLTHTAHALNAALTIRSWDSPIAGKGSTSRKKGDLGRDEADDNVGKKAVNDPLLRQSLPIKISVSYHIPFELARGVWYVYSKGKKSIHQALVDQQHAEFTRPYSEDHDFLRQDHPFASNLSAVLYLRRQRRYLRSRHVIRPAAEDDLVDGHDQKRVPRDSTDDNPVVGSKISGSEPACLRCTCVISASPNGTNIPQLLVNSQSGQDQEHPDTVECPRLPAELGIEFHRGGHLLFGIVRSEPRAKIVNRGATLALEQIYRALWSRCITVWVGVQPVLRSTKTSSGFR